MPFESECVADRDVQIQAEPSVVFNLVAGQDPRSSVFQVNATAGRPEAFWLSLLLKLSFGIE